jgi:hypothetical protein
MSETNVALSQHGLSSIVEVMIQAAGQHHSTMKDIITPLLSHPTPVKANTVFRIVNHALKVIWQVDPNPTERAVDMLNIRVRFATAIGPYLDRFTPDEKRLIQKINLTILEFETSAVKSLNKKRRTAHTV